MKTFSKILNALKD